MNLEGIPTSLTVLLLGPMLVRVKGQPLPHLRSRKALWLLALLVLRDGRPVEREWLAETLWPDVDLVRSSSNLRVVLSELRHALSSEGHRLQSPSRHTLSFDLTGAAVDVHTFDTNILGQEPSALRQAAALYRGPLLEGCTEEWVPQERAVREQACLHALEVLAGTALDAGAYETAENDYRRVIGMDPWREAAQRGLMQALARRGDASAALSIYQAFIRLLRKDDPRAVPDELTTALYARLRAEAKQRASAPNVVAVLDTAVPVISGYLPHPLTDLVGREDEREEVTGRLRRSRLVTLTGPGGIGKTRLALEVAAEAAPEFADGVWLVALDALSDEKQVVPQIAGVLGLREEVSRAPLESLTDHMLTKRLLLVLDNCEHLLNTVTAVTAHLLRACAGLHILTTSREVLGLTGEVAWSVPALSVPDLAHLPSGSASRVRVLNSYDAIRLFTKRAQGVQKTFSLTGENARLVAHICIRLEGVPLAIELAAARVRSLTVEQIATRLDDHLSLLTGGSSAALSRQRTLRATLDWSYGLLIGPERILLARLSVFAGGCDLEAAEKTCGSEEIGQQDVLDLITSLVEKSLLVFDNGENGNTGGRYRMLEMVRQYAQAQLEASGESDQLKARHRDWFAFLATEAYAGMRGAEQVAWRRRLEMERENFRAALTWIGTDAAGVETCLHMVGSLWWFWYIRGYLSEGKQLMDAVLEREEVQAPTRPRGRALNGLGTLSAVLGDFEAARTRYEESLHIFQSLGDRTAVASALGNLGNVAIAQGEYALAQEHLTQSLGITREIGQAQPTAASLGNLAEVALAQGDYAAGEVMHTEALSIFRTLGDKQGIARTLHGLAAAAYFQGDPGRAGAFADKALTLFRELQEPRGICDALSVLGDIALLSGSVESARALYRESLTLRQETGAKEGVENSLREFAALLLPWEPQTAARLWGSAEALRETTSSKLPPIALHRLELRMMESRAALGEAAFSAAWAEGRALTWEQAADYALEEK